MSKKKEGGLAIRKMKPFNKALFAKQSWRAISGDQRLSMQVLRNKYIKGRKGFAALSFNSRASFTWKGITRQVDVLGKGVGRNIFNG